MTEASEHMEPDTVPYSRAQRSQTPEKGCDRADKSSKGDRWALSLVLLRSKQQTDPRAGSQRGNLPKCFCVFFSDRSGFPGGKKRNEKSKEPLWL